MDKRLVVIGVKYSTFVAISTFF